MIDFASALYLGMKHDSCSLRPWQRITSGFPAALEPVAGAEEVAAQLAALQGCEAATMGTSTLHLVWDLLGMVDRKRSAIYLDEGAYPILRWGVERAKARGVPVRVFRHHNAEALGSALQRYSTGHERSLVVADGLCPACGGVAPIREYLNWARRYRGVVLLDDTQALGILGSTPGVGAPYGTGGGGSLRWVGISAPDLIVVSSLAKGFGAPAAVLSGSAKVIAEFEDRSETRVHCSPPSVASLRAVENALRINRHSGERLRARLARLVVRFRRRLRNAGFHPRGGLFPIQTISTSGPKHALALHEHLLRFGIRSVLHRGRDGRGMKISFLIAAGHRSEQIDLVSEVLSTAPRGEGRSISAGVTTPSQ